MSGQLLRRFIKWPTASLNRIVCGRRLSNLVVGIQPTTSGFLYIDLPLPPSTTGICEPNRTRNVVRVCMHPLRSLTAGKLKADVEQSINKAEQPDDPNSKHSVSITDSTGSVKDEVLVIDLLRFNNGSFAIEYFNLRVEVNAGSIASNPLSTPSVELSASSPAQSVCHPHLSELVKKRKAVDRVARKSLNFRMWTLFALMGLQTGLLARWTWWDYSWDVVEPITYCLAYGTCIAWYAYFLLHHKNLNYETFAKAVYLRKFYGEAKRSQFDVELYNRAVSLGTGVRTK